MPTRKIEEPAETRSFGCVHPEHRPPMNMVYSPGLWEHECPGCHQKVRFRVQGGYLIPDYGPAFRLDSSDASGGG